MSIKERLALLAAVAIAVTLAVVATRCASKLGSGDNGVREVGR